MNFCTKIKYTLKWQYTFCNCSDMPVYMYTVWDNTGWLQALQLPWQQQQLQAAAAVVAMVTAAAGCKDNTSGQSNLTQGDTSPHTDGSIVFTRWRQYTPASSIPNRHRHCTGAVPCWVALSISTTLRVQACPGLAPQTCPLENGDLEPT